MLDDNKDQRKLGRRAMTVGVGAMLLGGTAVVGRAACAANATDKVDSEKPNATIQLAPLAETVDINFAKPAPFTGEQFWTSTLKLMNDSFTKVITRERVEQVLGRSFARFSDEARTDAFLDMGKTWYFDVKYSSLQGILEVRGVDHGQGVFSNGPLTFDPLVAKSLESMGWVRYLLMNGGGLHAEHDPWIGVSYKRNGKAISFDLIDGKHVSNFGIALNHTNPDWK